MVEQGKQPAEDPTRDQPSVPADLPALLDEAVRERDQFRALAQRAQADLVNYRRRVDEERQAIGRNAASQVLLRIVPLVDDFQRASAALPADAPAAWREGVEMIIRRLQSVLESEGVTAFEPDAGSWFDPAQHEAVYYQPTADRPPGSVVSSVRRGYRTADRILRPAQVVVAQAQE